MVIISISIQLQQDKANVLNISKNVSISVQSLQKMAMVLNW